MANLIKYELKNQYKKLIILGTLIILVSLYLFTKTNNCPNEVIFASLLVIPSFVAFSVLFVFHIKLFSRDIHGDTGYLLFTIPKTGYSILGSKFIVVLIEILLIGLLISVFGFINLLHIDNIQSILSDIQPKIIKMSMIFVLIMLFCYFSLLINVYFSIVVSKISTLKQKINSLGTFIIFLIISFIQEKISTMLIKVFPQSMTYDSILGLHLTSYGNFNSITSFNIAATVFDISMFIILFIGTAYLIDKKMDL